MRLLSRIGPIALLVSAATLVPLSVSRAESPGRPTLREDREVAGSEHDFMIARHLVLSGSNEAIGRALAEIARDRYHVVPAASRDALRTRVQRRYFEKNDPILYERMRGVAAAFGKRVDDDECNFSGLDYGHLAGGCSVIHLPAGVMANGESLVSRDYDFTTGAFGGARPRPGQLAATARPYVIEMYPDRGYPSLAVCSYDLLSGVLDGINSEGLTVALLADDELIEKFRMEPAGSDGVGLGALQVLRMLLDTCATADEAKEALLLTKQYYEFVPVHYLVADRHGKSFVWEYSQAHNREYIVVNPDRTLVTTNFSLHRYGKDGKPPLAKAAEKVCPRFCLLTERLADGRGLTVDSVKETHKLVDATRAAPPGSSLMPNRTLWHALYFPERRKVQISFYLRDEKDPEAPGKTKIVRSDYLEFALRNGGKEAASSR
jgi:hypothetical protein